MHYVKSSPNSRHMNLVFMILLGLLMLCPSIAMAKDTLTLAIKGEPAEGYDPTLGWGRYGSPLFQSTLLKRNENMKIVTDLATSYSLSKDGLLWTVTIREDAKFSDGTPLTAKDVEYTFNTAAQAGGKVDLMSLNKAEAKDATTILFTLKKTDSTFVNRFISLGIVPKASHGPGYARMPIGSGPYRMVEWNEGQQMIAEANPYYYGDAPYFKRLVFLFTDEDTSFAAAKAGQVDIVVVPQALAVQTIPGMTMHAVHSVDNRGLMFPTVPATGKTTDKGAPIGNDVTADKAIRQAINKVIDRKALVAGILEGYGSPAYSVCDGLPWFNPANTFADNDADAARKILADAGWKDSDGDGIVEKNGLKAEFTIIYPAERSIRQYLALASADMIKKIGINAKVEGKRSWDEIKQLMHSNVIVFGWGSHDPIEIYHLYSSHHAGDGYNNPGLYTNPKVDEYLDKALAAPNYEASLEYWMKSQWDGETGTSALGDAPWAWLVNLDHTYFISDHLNVGTSQVEPHGHGWPITANIEKWTWID
ncbi:ABC transporter substrate-binding protein [Pseudodesulfovibrio sediminis]|uniref:ABC transporter substrate-binding protein n=1 Tax=Pseudodesulfovibrio sediminis TaxID=2810563 RepID=A0ABN6EXU9_9BACT|nr:ABC transporter substrate-binding protein [Pseudodesulfovibrio sediminis]BCS89831.1 ABC transporter substrate-binding protein [Pseudodesulfovibrio sediminis]